MAHKIRMYRRVQLRRLALQHLKEQLSEQKAARKEARRNA